MLALAVIAWLLTSLSADEWKALLVVVGVAIVVYAASMSSRAHGALARATRHDRSAARLSRRVSDSRAHDVSRLELARRHAARRPDGSPSTSTQWAELGVRAWAHGWWEMPVSVGDEIAPLIGAGAGEVAMLPNVTIAQTSVLSALDYATPRDTIVMTELDFRRCATCTTGSRRGSARASSWCRATTASAIDTERLLAAIDERTRLVAISHVLFRSAYIMDVARDLPLARMRSARSCRSTRFIRWASFPST